MLFEVSARQSIGTTRTHHRRLRRATSAQALELNPKQQKTNDFGRNTERISSIVERPPMAVMSRLEFFAFAAIIALPVFGGVHPASAGSDADFINIRGDGAAAISSPVYRQVLAPWSEAWFQTKFPDLIYARDASVEFAPFVAPDPRAVYGSGARPHAKGAGGIGAPKITIKRRPSL